MCELVARLQSELPAAHLARLAAGRLHHQWVHLTRDGARILEGQCTGSLSLVEIDPTGLGCRIDEAGRRFTLGEQRTDELRCVVWSMSGCELSAPTELEVPSVSERALPLAEAAGRRLCFGLGLVATSWAAGQLLRRPAAR